MSTVNQGKTNLIRSALGILFLGAICAPTGFSQSEQTPAKAKEFKPLMSGDVFTEAAFKNRSGRPDQIRRNEIVRQKVENGVLDPEPVLIDAIQEAFQMLHDPTGSLELIVYDEDKDLLGLRIKEQYIDPNGKMFTYQEDYPVWIAHSKISSRGHESINVRFRLHKDQKHWREYVDHVNQVQEYAGKNGEDGPDALGLKPPERQMPPVWMAAPEPERVRVFVSVYDRAGHESETVEIDETTNELGPLGELSSDYDRYSQQQFRWEPQPYASTVPTDQANAALFYYQAIINLPERDLTTFMVFDQILRGHQPDKSSGILIKKYLNRCLTTLKLTDAASRIPRCNWNDSHTEGIGSVPLAQLRQLGFHLHVVAKILAYDENYRAALETCLIARRLARHVGDSDLTVYLVSLAIDRNAVGCIRDILGTLPPDADILRWLDEQLAMDQGAPKSFVGAMESQFKHASQSAPSKRDRYKLWRRELAIVAGLPYDENETIDLPEILLKEAEELKETWKDLRVTDREKDEIKMLLSLTDGQLLERSRRSYEKWLNSVIRISESDIPYEEKYAQLRRMEDELNKVPNDPNSILSYFDPNGFFSPSVYSEPASIYGLQVQHRGELNALIAAIEICLAKAKTGRLPDSLPPDLPKDPFSGQDFEYEITEDGFALRCRGRDLRASPADFRPGQPPKILSDKFQQYEFKVRK